MKSSVFLVPLIALTWFAARADAQLQCVPATLQSTSAPGDFGSAVSIFGDTAAVGTLEGGGGHGPVFIYGLENGTWLEQQQLTPTATPYGYGRFLSLSGSVLAVGGDDIVYIYRYDGLAWIEEQAITSADPSSIDFGAAVIVEGDNLIITTLGIAAGRRAGAVHVRSMGQIGCLAKLISASCCDRSPGHLGINADAIVAVGTPVFNRFDLTARVGTLSRS
jgi:hypothetical protein